MSRDGRDPTRDQPADNLEKTTREYPERLGTEDRLWCPSERLTLSRSPDRQVVTLDRERYLLRQSETELLATVGAFRVVPERELLGYRAEGRSARIAGTSSRADIRSLSDQGLIETRTITINHSPERVIVLTSEGKELLERYSERSDDGREPEQQYYSGLVKPRELAHDAQLYRMFQIERDQLESDGARITRVVLDYELKHEYHTYVHEQRETGVSASDARRDFAERHDLPFAQGHIELPDVRIEYESPDGERLHRDLELATEHYSRSQIGGKQSAGFRVYRATGCRSAGGGKSGGSPFDPHHLRWLR